MTNNELLLSISNLIDTKLNSLEKHMDARMDSMEKRLDKIEIRLDRIETRVDEIEARLDRIETRVDEIEARVDEIEARLDRIETRVDEIEARLDRIETRVDEIEARLDCKIDALEESLGEKIHRINLNLENQVLPRIKEIESCYLSTYERYKQGNAKLEQLQLDVTIIKDVLLEHGEKLKIYQQKLAMA